MVQRCLGTGAVFRETSTGAGCRSPLSAKGKGGGGQGAWGLCQAVLPTRSCGLAGAHAARNHAPKQEASREQTSVRSSSSSLLREPESVSAWACGPWCQPPGVRGGVGGGGQGRWGVTARAGGRQSSRLALAAPFCGAPIQAPFTAYSRPLLIPLTCYLVCLTRRLSH